MAVSGSGVRRVCVAPPQAKGDKGPRRTLADFLIGAHADLTSGKLLTLNPKLYRSNFAGLEVVVPS